MIKNSLHTTPRQSAVMRHEIFCRRQKTKCCRQKKTIYPEPLNKQSFVPKIHVPVGYELKCGPPLLPIFFFNLPCTAAKHAVPLVSHVQ